MTTYTIYLPPVGSFDNSEEGFRLVPDAKATLALIFPPFWLAWHRLWLPLMVYIVVIAAILMIAIWSPSVAVSYLSILPGVYLLLEGYQLLRQNLEAKGWQFAGVVEGENREEAEIRFLVNSGKEFTTPTPKTRSDHKPAILNTSSKTNNMGLFPE